MVVVEVVVVLEACGVRVMRLGEGDAEVADLVAVDFEDGDIDDDLGAGAVEIVDDLLREEKLVGRGAEDERVLRRDGVDLDGGVEDVADGGEDLVEVVGLRDVGEVEGLDGELVEVGALLAVVGGDEDGVRGDGLVEGSGEGADDAEGVHPGDVGELDGDALGLVVGVEEDVEAGRLADGAVDGLGVFDGVEGDGILRDGLKLDGAGDGVDVAEGLGLVGGLLEGVADSGVGGAPGGGRHVVRMLDEVDFLRRGLIRGVDRQAARANSLRAAGMSPDLLEDAATIDVGDTGEEAHALVGGSYSGGRRGFLRCGLTIVLVGGVVVLVELGVLGSVVPGAGGLGVGLWTGDGDDARRG